MSSRSPNLRRVAQVFQLLALASIAACSTKSCCFGKECDVPVSVETTCWTHSSTGARLACGSETGAAASTDHEPNDMLTNAVPATGVSCSQAQVSGVIEGDDVDMYVVEATLCDSKAWPAITFNRDITQSNLRMCLFLMCTTGSTGIGDPEKNQPGCGAGGAPMYLPEGMLGCCTSQQDMLSVNVSCSNHLGTVKAYVVIDGASNQCVPYNVTYSL